MLKKIEGRNKEEQIKVFIKEADRMITEYGWQERTVLPYSFPVKVTDIIDKLKKVHFYTKSSRDIIIAEANGLPNILNYWEQVAVAPKVTVRYFTSGKVKEISKIVADDLVDVGMVEII